MDLVKWTPISASKQPCNVMLWWITLDPACFVKCSSPISHFTTIVHTATLELLDAVQPVTVSSIETRHVIICVTFTQAFVVEGPTHVFVVAVKVGVRQIFGFTATAFFNVVEFIASIHLDKQPTCSRWKNIVISFCFKLLSLWFYSLLNCWEASSGQRQKLTSLQNSSPYDPLNCKAKTEEQLCVLLDLINS